MMFGPAKELTAGTSVQRADEKVVISESHHRLQDSKLPTVRLGLQTHRKNTVDPTKLYHVVTNRRIENIPLGILSLSVMGMASCVFREKADDVLLLLVEGRRASLSVFFERGMKLCKFTIIEIHYK